MKTYRHFARIWVDAADQAVTLDLEAVTYDENGTLLRSRSLQIIRTDVYAGTPGWSVEAIGAANQMLTIQDWDALGEWRPVNPPGFMVEICAGARSDVARLAAKQIRRGVDATGAYFADVPRCNDVAPDGSTACNLAGTHRALDPSDRHEYFVPVPGGRTLLSWAHCAEPRCCHYAATGQYCTGHALQAGLVTVHADRTAD